MFTNTKVAVATLALLWGAPLALAATQESADQGKADVAASNSESTTAEAADAGGAAAADTAERSAAQNNYPTAVIADYVLGCMAANGNSYIALQKCSCSIDFISQRISYEDYEKISTIMEVQLDEGQRGIFYRDSAWAKNRVDALSRIQAESTLRCF